MAAMGRLQLLTIAWGDRLVLPTKRLFKGFEIQRHGLLESAKISYWFEAKTPIISDRGHGARGRLSGDRLGNLE